MIKVESLTKTYGKKDTLFNALKDVSFTIPEGSTLAIVGKSGSGKSTLMHIMSGLDHATSGEVIIGKQKLSQLSAQKMSEFRSQQMSFIFQSFFVEANQTCLQNIMLPLEIAGVPTRKRRSLVDSALKAVDLEDKTMSKAGSLSGGQKQRLAIARAIVNKPKLIFADEPTGNLDSYTGGLITELLFSLNKTLGCTIIIVTHDDELANLCQQKIYLKDGVIDRIIKHSSKSQKNGDRR